jgi:hypothetical protein
MIAFKFLSAHFGLKTLSERRIKISRVNELNDPFELTPFDLRDRRLRRAMQMTRSNFNRRFGLVCLSANWHDPVLWAHYSEKHTGLCIGFEIPDDVAFVRYVPKPLQFPANFNTDDIELGRRFLFTKYEHWAYEEEVRIFANLIDQTNGIYYYDFDDLFRPVMVIVGIRCTLTKNDIVEILGPLRVSVRILKARAAFREFRVVEDRRGLK